MGMKATGEVVGAQRVSRMTDKSQTQITEVKTQMSRSETSFNSKISALREQHEEKSAQVKGAESRLQDSQARHEQASNEMDQLKMSRAHHIREEREAQGNNFNE